MKKITTSVIIVIAIGPDAVMDFVIDTVNSYIFYSRVAHRFILADDSGKHLGRQVADNFADIDVLVNEKPMGGWAGLYLTLARAFQYALQHYNFDAILKLDTDALVIGTEPEREALDIFRQYPLAGMAGQYPLTYAGEPWNIRWPKQRILNSTRSWKFIRRPLANLLLIRFHNRALRNGYSTGESVFGGAYFLSSACLQALMQAGVLPNYRFGSLNIGEDHLFSLLVKAVGFNLVSLSSPGGPMACEWQGLPAAPTQLSSGGKIKIIHSVKYWQDMDEAAIRAYFIQQRI